MQGILKFLKNTTTKNKTNLLVTASKLLCVFFGCVTQPCLFHNLFPIHNINNKFICGQFNPLLVSTATVLIPAQKAECEHKTASLKWRWWHHCHRHWWGKYWHVMMMICMKHLLRDKQTRKEGFMWIRLNARSLQAPISAEKKKQHQHSMFFIQSEENQNWLGAMHCWINQLCLYSASS